jgi:hypothetical protein
MALSPVLTDGATCITISIMRRVTTTVDPSTYGQLEDLARRDGVATASLVRDAMERYVTERQREMAPLPLPDWVGMFEGDGESFAENTEEILGEIADEVHRTEILGEPKRPRT